MTIEPQQSKPAPPGWYPNGDGLWWWDGTAWSHPATPAQPITLKSSNSALWSVILGACGLIINPLTLIGLPLALVALGNIRRGAETGKGMAVTGIVLNGLVWAIWAAIGVGALINGTVDNF